MSNTPEEILECFYTDAVVRAVKPEEIIEAIAEAEGSLYQLILTEVIGEDEVFVDIPVLDGYGKQTSIIAGESYTEYMVMRNGLRKKQRQTLAKLFNKEIN